MGADVAIERGADRDQRVEHRTLDRCDVGHDRVGTLRQRLCHDARRDIRRGGNDDELGWVGHVLGQCTGTQIASQALGSGRRIGE